MGCFYSVPMEIDQLVLISVGNTRTRWSTWRNDEPSTGSGGRSVGSGLLEPSRVLENGSVNALGEAVAETARALPAERSGVVVASVNDAISEALVSEVRKGVSMPVVRLVAPGDRAEGLKVPVQHALTEPVTVGVDRLLAALGAHAKSGDACVVIDAGTAVTVDFIDAWGVFQGGVIAPGLGAMLRAMHEGTSRLPLLTTPRTPAEVPSGPIGRTTREAMMLGAMRAIQGLAHRMIDQYAEVNGAYPRVIATGGDAALLFEHDELVEHVVPDLVLMGMASAWRLLHADPDAGEGAGGAPSARSGRGASNT